MSRIFLICCLLGSAVTCFAIDDVTIPTTDMPVKGEWIGVFSVATNLSVTTHTPMLFEWGNKGCGNCKLLKHAFLSDEFVAWRKSRSLVYCTVEGVNKVDVGVNEGSGAKEFAWSAAGTSKTRLTSFPFVCLYWPLPNGQLLVTNFVGKANVTLVGKSRETLARQVIDSVEMFFRDYFSPVAFATQSKESSACLQAVEGAGRIGVPLVRSGVTDQTMSSTVTATLADGGNARAEVEWAVGQTQAMVEVPFVHVGLTNGAEVVLSVKTQGYDDVPESFARVVAEPENSPKNPYWFGERVADTLMPGEWTMDRDLALTRAAAVGGSTLTLIGGSLWCPDCVNADAYLVDTAMFKEWAVGNGIYCAAVDVPSFPRNGKTCLLTYEPTTVSARYINATMPKQDAVQAGAGYLSRKLVPWSGNDGKSATDVLARNLNLTTNAVDRGGLCRPECIDSGNSDTGPWKTGVPCFILQNADGRIVGRLYQFSNVSPTNAASAAAYVQRLDELRQLSDDPTEELNKHWSTAVASACALSVRGGKVASTISAIDTSDFWHLAGRTCWTRTTFTVKGASGSMDAANARLKLWRQADGKTECIAASDGNLREGISLEAEELSADVSIEYFVQLEVIEDSDDFKLEHAGSSVVNYVLSAESKDDSGVLSFGRSADRVTEADAKKSGGVLIVYVPVERNGGATGTTNATAVLDEAATTAFPDRYRLVTDTVSWADGETTDKGLVIEVYDDGNADGEQELVLKLGDSTYELTIVDNDKIAVGKLAFSDAMPAIAKKGTVIAEEGSTVRIAVSRVGGASGNVGCTLRASDGEFVGPAALTWESRESGVKWTQLKLPKLNEMLDDRITVSFAELDDIKADSSNKLLTIQLVGSDAPRFESDARDFSLVRYCSVSDQIAVVNLAEDATAKVTKLSGALPSGLTAKLEDSVLRIAGTPSRTGYYEAVYQVSQVSGRRTTPGLTVRLTFFVSDVSVLDPSVPGANPSVAKSRTFQDQPIVDAVARRLTGLVTGLTVPPTGKCSAKYKCAEGTVSLSAKCWAAHDAETGELTAQLTSSWEEYRLVLHARADGSVAMELVDPNFAEGALACEVKDEWGLLNPATAWMGYYTVAIDAPDATKTTGDVLASGNPIITLKMQTLSLARKGGMSYAGVLPNGQSFSGSATLVSDGLDTAILPVYYRTTRDFFTLAPQIKADAPVKAVECGGSIYPWWRHEESVDVGAYEAMYLRIAGSYYDAKLDLLDTLNATAEGHDFSWSGMSSPIPVSFTSKSVSLDAQAAKPVSARISFNKSTGMISGSFKVANAAGKAVTASYKGVVLPDWGDGCPSCGDVPWALGSFWRSESIGYESVRGPRSLSVKVGGQVMIESY